MKRLILVLAFMFGGMFLQNHIGLTEPVLFALYGFAFGVAGCAIEVKEQNNDTK